MSSVFSSPKKPKIAVQQAEAEPVEMVTEDATVEGRRKRKALAMRSGAESTRISGIESALLSALKKRLGE